MKRARWALWMSLAACGAAQAPASAPTPERAAVATTMDVMVIRDRSALGALEALLPADLDLTGRALLLPGGWLPDHAARVIVVDPTAAPAQIPGGVIGAGSPASGLESVVATVSGGALSIGFEHDVNADGWCCSGIQRPDRAECDGMPPLPMRAEGDPLYVYLFVVPAEMVATMRVARTTSICERP